MVNTETEQKFWTRKLRELQEADYSDCRASYQHLIEFADGTVPLTSEAINLAFAWEIGLGCAGKDSLRMLFVDLRHYFQEQLNSLADNQSQPRPGVIKWGGAE